MSGAQPSASPALEAFLQRREVIAGDIAKLEKQVRACHIICSVLGPLQRRDHRSSSPPGLLPQIYELESAYFTADCTNFGNVVKARRAGGLQPPPRAAAARRHGPLPSVIAGLLTPPSGLFPPCRASTSS